jgi:hypothetical protein
MGKMNYNISSDRNSKRNSPPAAAVCRRRSAVLLKESKVRQILGNVVAQCQWLSPLAATRLSRSNPGFPQSPKGRQESSVFKKNKISANGASLPEFKQIKV